MENKVFKCAKCGSENIDLNAIDGAWESYVTEDKQGVVTYVKYTCCDCEVDGELTFIGTLTNNIIIDEN